MTGEPQCGLVLCCSTSWDVVFNILGCYVVQHPGMLYCSTSQAVLLFNILGYVVQRLGMLLLDRGDVLLDNHGCCVFG